MGDIIKYNILSQILSDVTDKLNNKETESDELNSDDFYLKKERKIILDYMSLIEYRLEDHGIDINNI